MENACVLRLAGFRAMTRAFDGSKGGKAGRAANVQALLSFLWAYFHCDEISGCGRKTGWDCTFRPPVILQHQGHSRVCVGVVASHGKPNSIVVLDPGLQKKTYKDWTPDDFSKVIVGCQSLFKHSQFEVMFVSSDIASLDEQPREPEFWS